MLQCRSGKRTGKGAIKIAVDMVNEGLVDIRSAIKMVEPQHLDQLLHPQVYTFNVIHARCGLQCTFSLVNNAMIKKSYNVNLLAQL